jgi:hypothetical protein
VQEVTTETGLYFARFFPLEETPRPHFEIACRLFFRKAEFNRADTLLHEGTGTVQARDRDAGSSFELIPSGERVLRQGPSGMG